MSEPFRCNLGEFLDPTIAKSEEKLAAVQEGATAVLGFLWDFSYEELGDEIPSNEPILEACQEQLASPHIEDAECTQLVNAVVSCVQKQYLGQCATSGCGDRNMIREMISRLPSKEAV